MRYTLQCCHCEQSFLFDFSKSKTLPDQCPFCHERFVQHEFSKANNLLDMMDDYNRHFTSLKIKRAFEPTAEESCDTEMGDKVFSSDIQHIVRLYERSKGEHRQLLGDIIDKLYLLLNRDVRAKSDTFPSSRKVYDLLNTEFEEGRKEQEREMLQCLNSDT